MAVQNSGIFFTIFRALYLYIVLYAYGVYLHECHKKQVGSFII